MPNEFDPRAFLRKAPNQVLICYFRHRCVLQEFDWTQVTETKINPLYEAWQKLPEGDSNKLIREFQEIDLMATPGGKQSIFDEVDFRRQSTNSDFREQAALISEIMEWDPDFHELATSTLLLTPDLWAVATQLTDADNKPKRYWRLRRNLPWDRDREIVDEDGDALSDELKFLLFEKQGRGKNCEVNVYRRGEKEYFFAYPQDHNQTTDEYSEEGKFKKRPHNPAIEIVFIFDREKKTLRIWWPGSALLIPDLQVAFAISVLKEEIERDSPKDTRVYDLDKLKDSKFEFTIKSEWGIENVLIRGIRITVAGKNKERLQLEIGPETDQKVLYDRLGLILDDYHHSKVWISLVRIRVSFEEEPGRPKRRTRTFDVSWPNSCSLNNEGTDLILHQMLHLSGIDLLQPPDEVLNMICERVANAHPQAAEFIADEIAEWTPKAQEFVKKTNLLKQSTPAKTITCNECEEACTIPITISPDEKKAWSICELREDISRIDIDMARLERRKVDMSDLADLIIEKLGNGHKKKIESEKHISLGNIRGKHGLRKLSLFMDKKLKIQVAGQVIELEDVLRVNEVGEFIFDRQLIQQIADMQKIGTTSPVRREKSTARRDAKKLETEERNAQIKKVYVRLRAEKRNLSGHQVCEIIKDQLSLSISPERIRKIIYE